MNNSYYDAPVHTPVADNKDDMLRFLLQRFRFAGVSDTVAKLYASDIEAILSEEDEARSVNEPVYMVDRVRAFGARTCGSRHVLTEEETKNSDFDFYITESQVSAFEQEFPQFTKCNFTNYADEITVGLYEYAQSADLSMLRLRNTEDKNHRIEVTVKKEKYAAAIDAMWQHLKDNPRLFRDKLWKRRGINREVIKNRIEHLVKFFM